MGGGTSLVYYNSGDKYIFAGESKSITNDVTYATLSDILEILLKSESHKLITRKNIKCINAIEGKEVNITNLFFMKNRVGYFTNATSTYSDNNTTKHNSLKFSLTGMGFSWTEEKKDLFYRGDSHYLKDHNIIRKIKTKSAVIEQKGSLFIDSKSGIFGIENENTLYHLINIYRKYNNGKFSFYMKENVTDNKDWAENIWYFDFAAKTKYNDIFVCDECSGSGVIASSRNCEKCLGTGGIELQIPDVSDLDNKQDYTILSEKRNGKKKERTGQIYSQSDRSFYIRKPKDVLDGVNNRFYEYVGCKEVYLNPLGRKVYVVFVEDGFIHKVYATYWSMDSEGNHVVSLYRYDDTKKRYVLAEEYVLKPIASTKASKFGLG